MNTNIILNGATFLLLLGSCYGDDVTGDVSVRFYTGSDVNNYEEKPIGQAAQFLTHNSWKSERSILFYIHGLTEGANNVSVQTVVQALLNRDDRNVLVVDYGSLAKLPSNLITGSVALIKNVGLVGQAVGRLIERMVNAGANLSAFHLVGFGLGPHVAAHAARTLTIGKLHRITGLDPALPGFYLPGVIHLKASDAEVVDVIHTDAAVLGVASTTGTADFYPNSGYPLQPGCPLPDGILTPKSICGTNRAWQYFAESITNPDAFIAARCNSWRQFKRRGCAGPTDRMGLAFSNKNTGTFYLETESQSPFGKGKAGAQWSG